VTKRRPTDLPFSIAFGTPFKTKPPVAVGTCASTASFWIVGSDGDGTYLVPKINPNTVYQTVGLTSNLHDLVRPKYGSTPCLYTVTMIPFYGRLVYDGTVTAANANPFRREPQTASPELAAQLRATVEQAKAAGRVVQRLRQLEVPGGSLEGLPAQGKISRSLEQHEQEPPTLAEKELVEQFCSFQVRMRHRVVAVSFAAKGTRNRTIPRIEGRPSTLRPDNYACYEFLLKEKSDTDVLYYHPPTTDT